MPTSYKRKAYINPKVGTKGLNLFDTARSIGDFQCRRYTNAFPTFGGSKSCYGFKVFNEDTTKTGGISMLHGYKKKDGTTKQLVFANADKYYYLTPSAETNTPWNSIGDYGTEVEVPHAYTSKDYVIFGTGKAGNTPKKWNGTNFTDITTPAVAGYDLAFYEFFQGQSFAALFGAGDTSNPSRLYYAQLNNPDSWSGGASGYIDIASDDGYAITGIISQGEQLIVYKNKNRYYVGTFYESNTNTYGIRVFPYKDNSGGTVAHDTIQVSYTGDITALAGKGLGMQGIGKLQSADGSLIPKEYSRDMMPIFDNINWQYAYKAKSILYDRKIWISVPYGKYTTTNNMTLVFNIDFESWSILPDVGFASFCLFEDENGEDVLYAGDADVPKIYVFDKNLHTFNNDTIFTYIRTGKLNIGSIIDYEEFETIALEGSMQTSDILRLSVIIDGEESKYDIDETFIVKSLEGNGFIGNDFIAEEYIPTDSPEQTDSLNRWMAVLLVNKEQRRGREVEIQMENLNYSADWSWDYLSINEVDFKNAKSIPAKHIIQNQVTI